ncbi:MAG: flagellar type III secretion system pore protein FliP [Exilispira sp.]
MNRYDAKVLFLFLIFVIFFVSEPISAQQNSIPIPNVNISIQNARNPSQVASSLEILLLISLLSLGPSLIISLTSYVRFIIVFDFLKRGLGTQQMPPAQVMAGLALFMTLFVMMPVFTQINSEAIQPYMQGKLDLNDLYYKGVEPLRIFMFKVTRPADIALFLRASNISSVNTYKDIPTYVLIPAFMLSELKTAFNIGILIMIPFLLIDMLVSATLMAMGMIMLPPIMISLPFKIIVFILADGWNLLVGSLLKSFPG